MKKSLTCLTLILGAALAVSAQAKMYDDLDVFNGTDGLLVNANHPITGTFDIATQDKDGIHDKVGYDPTVEHVTKANVQFLIQDDSLTDGPEKVTITLGSTTFINKADASYLFAVGKVKGAAKIDLSADGVLDYSITSDKGDFLAIDAWLVVKTRKNGASDVPDTAPTLALLATGLVGLGLVKRKV